MVTDIVISLIIAKVHIDLAVIADAGAMCIYKAPAS